MSSFASTILTAVHPPYATSTRPSVRPSVYPSVSSFTRSSVHPPVRQSVSASVDSFVRLSTRSSGPLPVYPSVRPSIRPSRLSIRPYVHRSALPPALSPAQPPTHHDSPSIRSFAQSLPPIFSVRLLIRLSAHTSFRPSVFLPLVCQHVCSPSSHPQLARPPSLPSIGLPVRPISHL